mmetsp:Transcript_21009/g.65987  ORF Transcript_21009/g.65987 Transcript_21009/m.65987 type:complete len:432 (+) Transcript_21009:675-1970(+)
MGVDAVARDVPARRAHGEPERGAAAVRAVRRRPGALAAGPDRAARPLPEVRARGEHGAARQVPARGVLRGRTRRARARRASGGPADLVRRRRGPRIRAVRARRALRARRRLWHSQGRVQGAQALPAGGRGGRARGPLEARGLSRGRPRRPRALRRDRRRLLPTRRRRRPRFGTVLARRVLRRGPRRPPATTHRGAPPLSPRRRQGAAGRPLHAGPRLRARTTRPPQGREESPQTLHQSRRPRLRRRRRLHRLLPRPRQGGPPSRPRQSRRLVPDRLRQHAHRPGRPRQASRRPPSRRPRHPHRRLTGPDRTGPDSTRLDWKIPPPLTSTRDSHCAPSSLLFLSRLNVKDDESLRDSAPDRLFIPRHTSRGASSSRPSELERADTSPLRPCLPLPPSLFCESSGKGGVSPFPRRLRPAPDLALPSPPPHAVS